MTARDPGRARTTATIAAPEWMRWAALAIDLAVIAGLAAGAAALADGIGLNDAGRTLLVALAAGAALATVAGLRMRLGTGPGAALLGLRLVDRVTGLPGVPLRREQAHDVRRGRDPLHPHPRPLRLLDAPPAASHRRGAGIARGAMLVLDDGTRHVLFGAAVLGRRPEAADGTQLCIAVPDLGRTMSRSHLVVGPAPGGVTVTDLGGPAGTWLLTDGEPRRLPPNEPVPVEFGAVLRCGSRRLAVLPRDGAAPAARTAEGVG